MCPAQTRKVLFLMILTSTVFRPRSLCSQNSLTSSRIISETDAFPNPKSRKCLSENRRWSFQCWPFANMTPSGLEMSGLAPKSSLFSDSMVSRGPQMATAFLGPNLKPITGPYVSRIVSKYRWKFSVLMNGAEPRIGTVGGPEHFLKVSIRR